ncbi:MAG: hypothetical protein AB1346_06950 [Thermodesulfobacteriota bacterium]
MTGLLVAVIPLTLFLMSIIQLSLLWMGKGAVDAAAHLAARKFARTARIDFHEARQAAFLEAYRNCQNRPGGSLASVAMTRLEIAGKEDRRTDHTFPGEPLCVRLTHGVELIVPWVDRLLYSLSPGRMIRLGNRYYLMMQSERWVTVE